MYWQDVQTKHTFLNKNIHGRGNLTTGIKAAFTKKYP